MRLHTLGDLHLEGADGRTMLRRRGPLLLLAYLSRRAPRRVSRAELATLLWGEREEGKARQSLRQALLELKRTVGTAIDIAPGSVAVAAGTIELDLAELERDAGEGRDRAAVERWTGDFLPGAEDGGDGALHGWIEVERAALRRRLGASCERLVDDAKRRGDWNEAIAIGQRWCELAPLDERAATRLIGALRLAGRHGAALAAHASFVARLREAIAASPSASFAALATAIDDDVVRESAGGTATTASLPWVGRDQAFATLTAGWRRATAGTATTVLMEGGPGMGASRTCMELARWVRDARPDAVVLRADLQALPVARDGQPWSSARAMFAPLARAPGLGGVSPASLAALHAVVPDLAARFPRLAVSPDPPSAAAVCDALRDALLALAEDGPVLVIADRLARADADTRMLVRSITRITPAPVMLVIADRTADIDDDAALAALRDDPAVVRVALSPLRVADIAALLEGGAELADRLHRDTAGIPALVIGHVDAMLAERVAAPAASGRAIVSPAADGRPLPTPDAARVMVRDVAHQLESARPALEALAVFGAPMTVADVASLAQLDPTDAERGVSELARHGIARVVPGSEGAVEIHPPVLARAAYELVPVLRREALHAGSATLLASRTRGAHDPVRLRHHRERAGTLLPPARSIWRRRATRIASGVVVVAVVIALAARLRPRDVVAARPRTVAVFPFSVHGSTELGFLRRGMVSLLGTSLDGAAGLRTLDSRTILASVARDDRVLSPDAARDVARHLGASLFVIGDAVGAEGQVELRASLYDVRNAATPLASVAAQGREADLFGLVDRLSAELAVSQGATSRGAAMKLDALTTSSLDALKAYLEGEEAYRANDMTAAMAAFERATAADSTFALAWYGLASAASWALQSSTERRASERAVRTSGRLSERDRLIVLAFDAYSRGDADSAERLASSVAGRYDDLEAWVILGETLYHHNWKRGRSLVESRRAWEHVLALDPRHWPALQHLSEVAAIEGRSAEADSLLRRYAALVGPGRELPTTEAFQLFAFGTPAARAEFLARMRNDRGFWLIASTWYVAVFARDLDGARALAGLLVEPVRPPEEQGFGRVLLAHLDMAGGRWRTARAELAIAAAHAPLEGAEHEALLSLMPLIPTASGASAPRELIDRLQSAPASSREALPWPDVDAPLHPLLRAYLRGMLSARAGDGAGAAAAMRTLDSLRDPTGPVALARGFRLAIRGELARTRHAPAEALALFERSARATPFVEAWASAFVSQAYERFVRAELLHASGRDEEAMRWYDTFDQNSPYDLVYLGPALYRQGQILERQGDRAGAAERYERFLAMWRDCDPELRPLTDDASRRLARIRAGGR